MKTEHDLNAYLAKQFGRRSPELMYLKVADKFSLGVSDFLLWKDGKSSAFESKFVKSLPKRTSTNILTHPFDGKQISFLRQMKLAGSPAFGLVGIKAKCSADGLYVLPFNSVLEKGNMTLGELIDNSIHIDLKGIDHLLEVLFE